MEQDATEGNGDEDRYNTHKSKWNNKLVIRARANDGITEHTQPNFTELGVVDFNGIEPAILHINNRDIQFGDPGSEEVLEIIDSAVKRIFEKNELVRKKMGHNVLARLWEKTLAEETPKISVIKRLKNLVGNRPE
jgi:hypothetical protein